MYGTSSYNAKEKEGERGTNVWKLFGLKSWNSFPARKPRCQIISARWRIEPRKNVTSSAAQNAKISRKECSEAALSRNSQALPRPIKICIKNAALSFLSKDARYYIKIKKAKSNVTYTNTRPSYKQHVSESIG